MSMWQTPAIVIAFLAWLMSPPATLADAARREALRRQLTPKATHSLTNQDVANAPPRPLPTVPASVAATLAEEAPAAASESNAPGSKKDTETHDETWWHKRMTAAQDELNHDQLLADALQSRINALTNDASARDDPAQRADLYSQRNRTIDELEKMKQQIATDKKAITAIQEDARKQGIPPGWIR
jgi:hypothetical protein